MSEMRHDVRMTTENPWVRLHRIAEARMKHIGMNQRALVEAGVGTGAWLRGLKNGVGKPSPRRGERFKALDRALRWTEGTSWDLLMTDRTEWPEATLEDEEVRLVEEDDEAGHLGTLVAEKLRQLSPEEFEAARIEIHRVLKLPILHL